MLALRTPSAVPAPAYSGAVVSYPSTPQRLVHHAPQYTPSPIHHSRSHHEEEHYFSVPYPELKDLSGPLRPSHHHHHHQHHHHPRHHRHGHHGHHSPRGHHHSPRGHHSPHQDFHHAPMIYRPQTAEDFERLSSGLPSFPDQWVETERNNHRPSYEQMLYSAYEHHHRAQMERARQHHEDGFGYPEYHQGSDLDAMNAALHGPHGMSMHHGNTGSPHHIVEAVRVLVDSKRHEAERIRSLANQIVHEKGPHDTESLQAQEAALQAEAEASGAGAVERTVENAAHGHVQEQIELTVHSFEEAKREAEIHWHDAQGRYGDKDERTRDSRMELLSATAAYHGAQAAQSAPNERHFESAEHPQAIANRARDAAEAYRDEAEQARREMQLLKRKYGASDKRTLDAIKAADDADQKATAALHEAEVAQALADGRPPPEAPPPKKKTKKKRGCCG